MYALLRWIRRLLFAVLGLVLLLGLVAGIAGYVLSGPSYQGPASAHFDGRRFRNPQDLPRGGFLAFLRWQWSRRQPVWQWRDAAPGPKPIERVARGALRATLVNHATVLIQQDGLNILTDPIWSDRTSPVSWAGPRRYRPPGLRFEDLPPIDAVIISHNHYDHLDLPTLRRLQLTHLPRFFVGLGNSALFVAEGIGPVTELDWWQTATLGPGVELTAVPAQHFSGRGFFDGDRTLWMGLAIKGPAGLTYFAGDTGAGPHFAEIRKRLGAPRLALLPIGAFRPEWFMSVVHVSPEQALDAAATLGALTSFGIHHSTFDLADDGQDEPLQRMRAALERRTPAPRFVMPPFGHGQDIAAAE